MKETTTVPSLPHYDELLLRIAKLSGTTWPRFDEQFRQAEDDTILIKRNLDNNKEAFTAAYSYLYEVIGENGKNCTNIEYMQANQTIMTKTLETLNQCKQEIESQCQPPSFSNSIFEINHWNTNNGKCPGIELNFIKRHQNAIKKGAENYNAYISEVKSMDTEWTSSNMQSDCADIEQFATDARNKLDGCNGMLS